MTKVPYYNCNILRPFSLLVLIAWSMVTRVGKPCTKVHRKDACLSATAYTSWARSVQCSTD